MIIMFKRWWSTVPSTSTQGTTTSYIKPFNTKRTKYIALEIQVLEVHVCAWNRHTNVAGLNWLRGSQPFPSDNWIYNYNVNKTKQ
jgi:hypothetical protein